MKNLAKRELVLFLLSILFLGITSCWKPRNETPKIKGCTNQQAVNYNGNADEDDGSCCIPEQTKYYRSGNVFELGFSVPFASFNFEQTDTFFTKACNPNKFTTTLKIQNLTGHNLSFSYSIQFRLNAITWSSSNNVTLSPGETLDLGEINQNPGRIDLGAIIIPCYNIRVF